MLNIKHENLQSTKTTESRWDRALRIEWLGQMLASLSWVVSVFTYGISSTGDVLQLCAALAWMVANLAALMRTPDNDN